MTAEHSYFQRGQLPPKVEDRVAEELFQRVIDCIESSSGDGSPFTDAQRDAPHTVLAPEDRHALAHWAFWNANRFRTQWESAAHVYSLHPAATTAQRDEFSSFWLALMLTVQQQIRSCRDPLNEQRADEEATERHQRIKERVERLKFEEGWNSHAIPPRKPLVKELLYEGLVSSIVAPGGGSKSTFCSLLAIALATGRGDIAGVTVVRPVKVMIHCGEDSLDEMRAKLDAVMTHYGVGPLEIAGRLVISSGAALDGGIELMAVSEDGLRRVEIVKEMVDGLSARMKELGVECMIFDPFIDMIGPINENDNGAIKLAVRGFTAIATEAGAAVLLAHHTSKAVVGGTIGPGDARGARGASAFIDGCRVVQTLTPMSEKEALTFNVPEAERRFYVRRDQAKFNLGPPVGVALGWFKRVGVRIANGDTVAVLVPWVPVPDESDGLGPDGRAAVLTKVSERWEAGRPLKRVNTADSALWFCIFNELKARHPGQRLSQAAAEALEERARVLADRWEETGLVVWQGEGRRVGFRVPEIDAPF